MNATSHAVPAPALAHTWFAAASFTAAMALPALAAEAPAKSLGHKVTVTQEMIGAGIVSSGLALPKPPLATGTRANPVPSWSGTLP